jgi:hypothetical protein
MLGLLTCTDRSLLEFISRYSGTGLGTANRSLGWWTSAVRSLRCSRKITLKHGVFCANFCMRVFGSKVCRSAWCATCYQAPPGVDFLVYWSRDEVTGEELIEEGTERRFLEARPGDHLFCSFECEICGFRRMRGSWPQEGNAKDEKLFDFMQ